MQFIDEREIRIGEYLGSGNFGAVYQYDDYAIKIYHELVKTDFGEYVSNPCLKSKRNLKRLVMRNSKIKNSNLIFDLLYINNEFKGVVYKYFEAQDLGKVIDSTTFSEKQNISYQLINNTKELNRHCIYHLDSKLNNILYNGEEIKIIDLDDVFTKITHIPNLLLQQRGLKSLRQTINYIFCADQYSFDDDLLILLDSYKQFNPFFKELYVSYKSLKNFVKERSAEEKLIFINPDYLSHFDIEKLKRIINFTGAKIVLIITNDLSYLSPEKKQEYIKQIRLFNQLNIPIYDIVLQQKNDLKDNKIIQCINNYNTASYYIFDNENIFDTFKGHQSLENDNLEFCINTLNCKTLRKK